MKIPKGFLFALIIIFIAAFITVGFSQEDKKQSTPQEKTTIDQKPQDEKKPKEKKSTPSEEAQQKYDYDLARILSESQRNVDRSINILNIIVTSIGVLVALLTLIIIIAIAFGIFESRRWRAIRINAERNAKLIESFRNKAEQDVSKIREEMSKIPTRDFIEKPSEDIKEKLDDFSRRLELFEWLGLPIKARDYIIRGFDLFNKGKYKVAIDAFDRSIKLDANNDFAWFGKSEALKKVRRYEEALEAIDKAIELKPDFVESWNSKGAIFYEFGRYKEALDVANKTIELKPDYGIAWGNKSLALNRLERYEEALEAANKAIELKPDLFQAWVSKAVTLSEFGRYEEALEAGTKAIELSPSFAPAWYNRACAYSKKGEKEKALKDLSKAIELNAEVKERAKKDEDFKDYWEDEEFKKITS